MLFFKAGNNNHNKYHHNNKENHHGNTIVATLTHHISVVSQSILENKVRFGNSFQFPFICRQAHSSISFRLEMASNRVKPSEFDARKNGIMFWVLWLLDISLSVSVYTFSAILLFFFFFSLILFFYYASTRCWSTSGHPEVEKSPYFEQVNCKAAWKQTLKKLTVKVWRTITPEHLERLYQLIPRRMAAFIAAHGGHTKYLGSYLTCICTFLVNKLTYLWQATKVFS